MADKDLSDEEKAKAVLGGVDDGKPQDEPPKADDPSKEEEDDSQDEPNKDEEEKPKNPDEENPPSFTKQFENLKGDSWDEYGPEVEKAYQNSSTEALKLRTQLKEAQDALAAAKAPAPADDKGKAPAAQPDSNPDVAWLKAEREKTMLDAFGKFTKVYPQATEATASTESFQRFEQVAASAESSFIAVNGRRPSYPELFEQTAKLYGWQPADKSARKDAAIKETASQSSTPSSSRPMPKDPNVSDKELDVARKLVGPTNTQSDSELLKDIAALKT